MTVIAKTSFGNNIDCGGDFVVELENGIVKVWFQGGCWGSDEITITITKDKIVVNDNGKVREVEW